MKKGVKYNSDAHYAAVERNSKLTIMEFKKSKKGVLAPGILNQAILGLVLLVVLFQLYAQLVPEAQAAGDSLNASGVPLGGLFVSSGIVFVIIMAALVILVVRSFLPGGK